VKDATMHLGFDRLEYPGDAVMTALRTQGKVSFTAFYLAPAPSQSNTSWMAHVTGLIAAGWGLAPVYVGQQAAGGPGAHTLTAAQGTTDAANACALAVKAGLPAGRVVYLDIEVGGTLSTAHLAYVTAWVTAMRAAAYAPGIYASTSRTAAQVVAAVGALPTWVFHPRDNKAVVVDPATEVAPDPATSGFAGATIWQYRMSLTSASRVDLAWVDSSGTKHVLAGVDMDSSTVADPSIAPAAPSGSSAGGTTSAGQGGSAASGSGGSAPAGGTTSSTGGGTAASSTGGGTTGDASGGDGADASASADASGGDASGGDAADASASGDGSGRCGRVGVGRRVVDG
jgi:hypothetical protein